MNFVKRAMCYVRRKSGKSVLLFFLFLVADITILGTLAILDTSSGINDEIRRQTNAKVVIENLEVNRSLTEQDYRKLLDIASINSMNRMSINAILKAFDIIFIRPLYNFLSKINFRI